MPTIRVEMLEGRNIEQKRQLAKRITDACVDIVQTEPQNVKIYFYDIPKFNLSKGGELRSDQESEK